MSDYEYHKDYNFKHRLIINAQRRERIFNKSEEEKEKIRKQKRDWAAKNKEWTRTYHKDRKQNDIGHKIKCYLRTRLYQALKGHTKSLSSIKLLGCEMQEFKNYIEEKFTDGMSWNNYGDWELDHIKPLSLFNLTIENEQSKAFHFTNFQPLWKLDNRVKRDNF